MQIHDENNSVLPPFKEKILISLDQSNGHLSLSARFALNPQHFSSMSLKAVCNVD